MSSMSESKQTDVLILGAGPAGLTAAHKLVERKHSVHIVDKCSEVGGLAKTLKHGDILYDIGPHILCNKEYVYDYNPEMYAYIQSLIGDEYYDYEQLNKLYLESVSAGSKKYKYPVSIRNAVSNVGLIGSIGIGFDYLCACLKKNDAKDYEGSLVSSLGRRLSSLFLLQLGEKNWGMPCSQMSADVAWRVGDFSIVDVVLKQAKGILGSLSRKGNPVSYPKKGIGVICERQKEVIDASGMASWSLSSIPHKLVVEGGSVVSAEILSLETGSVEIKSPRQVISSIPLSDLLKTVSPPPPENVLKAAESLRSRSHICVGLIFDAPTILKEHCIYFADSEIPFARMMEQNHYSDEMVPEGNTLLIVEYFCWFEDDVWKMGDSTLSAQTLEWLKKLGIVGDEERVDAFVHREKDAYPAYELGYEKNLEKVEEYLSSISNLHVIGRVGSFSYIGQYKAMQMGYDLASKLSEHDW